MTDWPQSSAQVLDLITKAERSRKFVWTAGRVLKEAALWTRLGELNYDESACDDSLRSILRS